MPSEGHLCRVRRRPRHSHVRSLCPCCATTVLWSDSAVFRAGSAVAVHRRSSPSFRTAEADPHGPDFSAYGVSPVAVRCQVVDALVAHGGFTCPSLRNDSCSWFRLLQDCLRIQRLSVQHWIHVCVWSFGRFSPIFFVKVDLGSRSRCLVLSCSSQCLVRQWLWEMASWSFFVFRALLGSTLDTWCCQSLWPFHRCSSWTRSCPDPEVLHSGGAAVAVPLQGRQHPRRCAETASHGLTVQRPLRFSFCSTLTRWLMLVVQVRQALSCSL